MTRTFSTCDIVIQPLADGGYAIYAQDFSFETINSNFLLPIPALVSQYLDEKYLRIFTSMNKFTEWLFEMGAVVNQCWFV